MPKAPLTPDSQFEVKDEKVLLYILGLFFLALFGYGLFDAIRRHFVNIDYQSIIFSFALIPAIFFFRRAVSHKVYIRVNKKGIYEHERLVTNWADFLNAYITQREKSETRIYDLRDNFVMVVEFRKQGSKMGTRRKLPLTNTQNKAEEEVLEAVKYFWQLYKQAKYVQIS